MSWYYKDPAKNDITFTESFNVTTWITVGNVEAVLNLPNYSNNGDFYCIPLKITQGNSVRKWWLAKGLGIVRLEYNTFEIPSIADLTVTNLTNYIAEDTVSQKNTVNHILSYPSPNYRSPTLTFLLQWIDSRDELVIQNTPCRSQK